MSGLSPRSWCGCCDCHRRLRFRSSSAWPVGLGLTQSFNGAGDTWTPTIINLFVFWLWELPLAYVLSIVFGMGPRGVFFGITIAFSTLAVVSAIVFRRGRWKGKVV